MKTILISEQPWAEWLADGLGELEARNVKALALLGIDTSTGEIVTGYFNCNMADKATMAANVQADALFDSVLANADRIIRRAEEMAEEEEDTDE